MRPDCRVVEEGDRKKPAVYVPHLVHAQYLPIQPYALASRGKEGKFGPRGEVRCQHAPLKSTLSYICLLGGKAFAKVVSSGSRKCLSVFKSHFVCLDGVRAKTDGYETMSRRDAGRDVSADASMALALVSGSKKTATP